MKKNTPPQVLKQLASRLEQRRVKLESLNAYGPKQDTPITDEFRGLRNGNRNLTPGNLASLASAVSGLVRDPSLAGEKPAQVQRFWKDFCTDLRRLAPGQVPSDVDEKTL